MEKLDEIDGVTGSKLDFGARIYDSRIARFLSLDPKMREYPFMSPYCFAANSPIRYIDEDGEGPGDLVKLSAEKVGKKEGYTIVFKKETGKTTI